VWFDPGRKPYPQIAIPHENLCDDPLFTGHAGDGRFALHAAADPLWKVSDRAVRMAVPFRSPDTAPD
jgi:hypothetical protein